jgi:ArsR family transcriptional regulator, arsenate/arsenite/antimonite-responsive transcriptional repressor
MRICDYGVIGMQELIRTFKALSDETRLRILNVLLEKECCVCEVMQALDISQTRASRNLNSLHQAGFLKMRKEGAWVLYSLDEQALKTYRGLLVKALPSPDGNQTLAQDMERLGKAERTCPAQVRASKKQGLR